MPKLPSFVACVFFAICSILLLFEALNLDTLKQKERREFEYWFNLWAEKNGMQKNHKIYVFVEKNVNLQQN